MAARKYSRQREAILTFLEGRTDHPTADTIYNSLREEFPNLSLGTVYRNLAVLEDMGEVLRISTGNGPDHYDGRTKPHQHFICRECGRVYDVDIDESGTDNLIRAAAAGAPGTIESCTTNFYGVCRYCLTEPSPDGIVNP